MISIHQFVAGFGPGDAISNEALVFRRFFRSQGFASDIFTEPRRVLPELRHEVRDLAQAGRGLQPGDIVLLHLSTGSIVNDAFAALPCRKALLYHNITPPEYFRGFQEEIAANLARGREQARRLAGQVPIAMADSRFNAAELAQWGCGDVRVLPIWIDFEKLQAQPSRSALKRYGDGLVNVLFVGRCAPNKRIEDLLAAFHYFQKYVEPNSRLIHAGSFDGTERYFSLLQSQSHRLRLQNVCFTGSVSQNHLNAFYRAAHLFLCMSEHEGFCIPLLESMSAGLPVLAYAAGAVPETLDDAGVLFREKQFDQVAEMMGRIVRDEPFRRGILDGQRRRIERYRNRNMENLLLDYLRPLLS